MRDPLDRYYTPPWVAAAVVRWAQIPSRWTVIEPSIGRDVVWARALRESGHTGRIIGVDIDPEVTSEASKWCDEVIIGDWPTVARSYELRADAIVGNPPYALAVSHIRAALDCAPRVGMFMRGTFVELSAERIDLWRELQPVAEWTITERIRFRCPIPECDPENTEMLASSMLWFRRGHNEPGWVRQVVSARRFADKIPSQPPYPEVDHVCAVCHAVVEPRARGGRRAGDAVTCSPAHRTALWRARRSGGVTRGEPARHRPLPLVWTNGATEPIVGRDPTAAELEARGQLRLGE